MRPFPRPPLVRIYIIYIFIGPSSILQSNKKLNSVSRGSCSEENVAAAAVVQISHDTAQKTNECVSDAKETIPSAPSDAGASTNIDSIVPAPFTLTEDGCSQIQKLSDFAPPRKNATTADKLSFLSVHPIQPSGDKNSLPFDGS